MGMDMKEYYMQKCRRLEQRHERWLETHYRAHELIDALKVRLREVMRQRYHARLDVQSALLGSNGRASEIFIDPWDEIERLRDVIAHALGEADSLARIKHPSRVMEENTYIRIVERLRKGQPAPNAPTSRGVSPRLNAEQSERGAITVEAREIEDGKAGEPTRAERHALFRRIVEGGDQ